MVKRKIPNPAEIRCKNIACKGRAPNIVPIPQGFSSIKGLILVVV
jgi:hypothetical protein